MKSTSVWTKDFQSVVDNGRNHSTVIDLPQQAGGSNNGPTALELCVMSFSGCIGTIFSLVAKKMRLEFDKMQVDVEAEKKDNAPTITDINCIVTIKSQEGEEKLKKCLEHTLKTCPVGLIFEQAGINITHEIKKQ
jgi:putative redox protein